MSDLDDAAQFFSGRLRVVDGLTGEKRLLWVRWKLQCDPDATAELILALGYRPVFVRYFIMYHFNNPSEWARDGAFSTVKERILRVIHQFPKPIPESILEHISWGEVDAPSVLALMRELEKGDFEGKV